MQQTKLCLLVFMIQKEQVGAFYPCHPLACTAFKYNFQLVMFMYQPITSPTPRPWPTPKPRKNSSNTETWTLFLQNATCTKTTVPDGGTSLTTIFVFPFFLVSRAPTESRRKKPASLIVKLLNFIFHSSSFFSRRTEFSC